MTYIAGSFGKYDKRVLRLIRRGRIVLTKRGKAYSGLSGKEVGSVKRGLKGTTDYVKVSLPIGKKKPSGKRHWEWFPLHRAIALAFYGLPPQGRDRVNHIDGNGLNNKLKNLEWCSAKENTQHAIAHGTFAQNGELNQMALLTDKKVRRILLGSTTEAEAALRYGVGFKTIQAVRRGLIWKHIYTEITASAKLTTKLRNAKHMQRLVRGSNLTETQRLRIAKSKLPVEELSVKHNRSCSYIMELRREHAQAPKKSRK